MRWIRQNIRGGVQFALFALAVQMVLTFGHVHTDVFASRPPVNVATLADEALDGPVQPVQESPSQPHRGSTVQDFCAVCASISVLGSSVLPAVAAFLMRRDGGRLRFALAPVIAWASETRSFSQARGPPCA